MSKQNFQKDIRDDGAGGGIISQRNQEISPELKDGSFQIEKAHQDPRTMDETHPRQGWWL